MQIKVYKRDRGGKVAEAELVFDKGPLAGLKLVGLDVWRGREDGELRLSLPGRSYEKDGKKQYYDYLRCVERDNMRPLTELREAILAEVRRVVGTGADDEEGQW